MKRSMKVCVAVFCADLNVLSDAPQRLPTAHFKLCWKSRRLQSACGQSPALTLRCQRQA